MKQWKLTDEDWRNREKWNIYEKYVDSMIMQTNTPFAPWFDIENNDKKYGRIKVMQTIVDVLKKELDD
jgi:polyphosphate kinase 2 (PPK2 family)